MPHFRPIVAESQPFAGYTAMDVERPNIPVVPGVDSYDIASEVLPIFVDSPPSLPPHADSSLQDAQASNKLVETGVRLYSHIPNSKVRKATSNTPIFEYSGYSDDNCERSTIFQYWPWLSRL